MRSEKQIEAAAEAMWIAMHKGSPARPGEFNLQNSWRDIGPNMKRIWLLAAEAGLEAADSVQPALRVVKR